MVRIQGRQAEATVYAAGTVYSLTNTATLINFGTTDPSITLTRPGTYLIFARARVDYNAATFAAPQEVTIKLRRTNNTAADITSGSAGIKTAIVTTVTQSLGHVVLPPTIYSTSNSDDVIQLFGSVAAAPGAGSLDVTEAEIVVVPLA